MKLKEGMQFPEIKYNNAYEEDLSYLEKIEGKKSVLLFLRYYG